MKKYLERLLKLLATLTLKRYKPKIIGITGSVGKTSTKEAVFLVLNANFKVRKGIGNYNNEIGVPLTILGEKSPGKSFIGWVLILIKSLFKLINTDYPEILVLEMGIDKRGDMDYLLSFIKLDIGIISAISEIPVHLENFNSVRELAKEKFKIISKLNWRGYAVINYDSKVVAKYLPTIKQNVLKFGLKNNVDITASNIVLNSDELMQENGIGGLSFKLHYNGKSSLPIRLPYVLAEHQIYAVLAAVACGLIFEMNLIEIAEAIKELKPPKGRLNILPGIKRSIIIDDTYNASPDSTEAALRLMAKLKSTGRKIAILGDMRELGVKTREAHLKIGREMAQSADILITVGKQALFIAQSAQENGVSKDKIYSFDNSEEAGLFIQNEILRSNDLMLVKGSQSVRMEKIVKEIMAEPMLASELIVRQDKRWFKA